MKLLRALPYVTYTASLASAATYSWFAYQHIFGTGAMAPVGLLLSGGLTVVFAFANLAVASLEPAKTERPSVVPLAVGMGSLVPLAVVALYIIIAGVQFILA